MVDVLRGILERTKSLTVQSAFVEDITWMRIRTIDLSTADGLSPLPMHVSWVRHGILVVGMDNETHVYTQWRAAAHLTAPSSGCDHVSAAAAEMSDNRTLTDYSLHQVASTSSMALTAMKDFRQTASSVKLAHSVSNMSFAAGGGAPNRRKEAKFGRRDSGESLDSFQLAMLECGMFEASR